MITEKYQRLLDEKKAINAAAYSAVATGILANPNYDFDWENGAFKQAVEEHGDRLIEVIALMNEAETECLEDQESDEIAETGGIIETDSPFTLTAATPKEMATLRAVLKKQKPKSK